MALSRASWLQIQKEIHIAATDLFGNRRKAIWGLPWRLSSKESACQYKEHESHPWSGKIPHAMEQLNPCATTIEPVLSSPGTVTVEAHFP